MSTGVNEVVSEFYREIMTSLEAKNRKPRRSFLRKMAGKVLSPYRKLCFWSRYFRDDYFRRYYQNVGNYERGYNRLNEFTPTEKVFPGTKIAVYTVSTGAYDTIKNPVYVDDALDYYAVTDSELPGDSVWKKINIPPSLRILSDVEVSRYVKLFPEEFLEGYDYSVYIDGNIRITCDIKPLVYSLKACEKTIALHRHYARNCLYDEAAAVYVMKKAGEKEIKIQMDVYRKEGFPKQFGLFENGIIIRKHKDVICQKIMKTWWQEIEKHTKRDQLSFTYALWKNGLDASCVMPLGNNSRKSFYFIVADHN